jgi:hypothetical protein
MMPRGFQAVPPTTLRLDRAQVYVPTIRWRPGRSTTAQRRARKKGSILEALRRSPLVGADLDLARRREEGRMRTGADKALVPNAETIEAMKAARRGDLVTVDSVGDLLADVHSDV